MAAIGVLVEGESGTGKTYSIRKFTPDEVKIISFFKPILPFAGKYEVVHINPKQDKVADKVIRELKNTDKKNIVIDDFQFLLGVPMMHRIGERGWEKYNDIQQPYADVLFALADLPDDVTVYFTSHTEQDENGRTKVKTIGKALDKYITIEGLFMIVLGTVVIDGKYYFSTQNNGNNTVKSPEGMFPSLLIPNDLKYVHDKILAYYGMTGAKTAEEMAADDAAHTVAEDVGKRKRKAKDKPAEDVKPEETKEDPAPVEEPKAEETPADDPEPPKRRTTRRTKKVDEGVAPSAKAATVDMYFRNDNTDELLHVAPGQDVPNPAEGWACISKTAYDAATAMNQPEEEVPFEEVPEQTKEDFIKAGGVDPEPEKRTRRRRTRN